MREQRIGKDLWANAITLILMYMVLMNASLIFAIALPIVYALWLIRTIVLSKQPYRLITLVSILYIVYILYNRGEGITPFGSLLSVFLLAATGYAAHDFCTNAD